MTQEDKELLLKDLCARLRYIPRCESKMVCGGQVVGIEITGDNNARIEIALSGALSTKHIFVPLHSMIKHHRLYLRPMSSMTEDEEVEYESIKGWKNEWELVDWLNAHHFDYRGLIEKGLALKAPEGMYK